MSLPSETETFPAVPQSLLGIFLSFLRRPVYSERPHPSQNRRAILSEVLRLYSLMITALIPIVFLISMVRGQVGAEEDPIAEFLKKTSLLVLLLAVVVAAPLLEEMIFRLPLRFSPLNVSLPLAFVLLIINIGNPSMRLLLAVAVGLLLRYLLHHRIKRTTGHAFYAKYIGWLFYGSTVLFGAIHIFNFDSKTYFVAPLIVMPQIMAGLFCGFIRLRHGYWWAVFAHGFHNFCAILPISLMKFGSTELQTNGFSDPTNASLSATDYVLIVFLLLYVGGGLFLCLRSAWKMLTEWRLERKAAKLSVET